MFSQNDGIVYSSSNCYAKDGCTACTAEKVWLFTSRTARALEL